MSWLQRESWRYVGGRKWRAEVDTKKMGKSGEEEDRWGDGGQLNEEMMVGQGKLKNKIKWKWDTCPSYNQPHPLSSAFRANKKLINTYGRKPLSPARQNNRLHPLHRKAASQKQKTKEKPVRRGGKNTGRSSQCIKNSYHHSNPGCGGKVPHPENERKVLRKRGREGKQQFLEERDC